MITSMVTNLMQQYTRLRFSMDVDRKGLRKAIEFLEALHNEMEDRPVFPEESENDGSVSIEAVPVVMVLDKPMAAGGKG